MKRAFNITRFFLLGIFFLALLLRVFELGSLPYSLHQDELMNGYVGRFIIENGRDLYGNRWPIFYFDRFGDYPNVIPMYFSGLSTLLFGVNELAVRLPIALFGALTVFPFYYLSFLVFKEKKVALFNSFLLAILPWHVVLSRATAEGILGLFFFSVALVLLLKAIARGSKKIFLGAAFCFLFTYFLYPSFRVITPLAIFPLPFLLNPQKKEFKKYLFILMALFLLITIMISQTKWGQGRYSQTSLFKSEEVSNRIKSNLTALSYDFGPGNIWRTRIFHSKIVAYTREFLSQYSSYFSPEFLFLKGGLPDRYRVPYQGLAYLCLGLLIVVGLWPAKIVINKRLFGYFLYLFLLAPLPAALTVDDTPNIHRAVFLILPLIMVLGLGFSKLNSLFPKFKMSLILFPFLFLEFAWFWNQYSAHTSSYKSFLRNDGSKELVELVKNKQKKYQKVIMPAKGTLSLYYLFYTHDFNSQYAGKFKAYLMIDKIGKIEFLGGWCPSELIKKENLTGEILIVDQGDCKEVEGLKEIKVIYRKDSTRAFRLLTGL